MDTFRLAFAGAIVVLLALVVLGVFSVALVGAAILIPLLMLMYVYSVDVYEDTPIPVIGSTVAWGATWGVLFGILGRALQGPGTLAGAVDLRTLVVTGVVLPLLGGAVMLAGPLFLLRDRRFNDVVDGTTFGVASAVSFVAAEILVGSTGMLSGGIMPVGDPLAWIGRILALGIAIPVTAGGAIGAACGAIWLRYRAPVRDRGELRWFGSPPVAVSGAGILLVASALATFLPGPLIDVAVQFAVAGAAVIWLRVTLHVGLLDEAYEVDIGAPILCANCGQMTDQHTFCGQCGVALHALPKRRSAGHRA